jgi:hypothetical protein
MCTFCLACNGVMAARQCWHSRQRRDYGICNLQELKSAVRFESRNLRLRRSLRLGSNPTLSATLATASVAGASGLKLHVCTVIIGDE